MNNVISNRFLIICLNQSNQIDSNSLNQLRQILNEVKVFNDQDECMDYLTDVTNKKIFMIISNNLIMKEFISFIHDFQQVHSIYMYSTTTSIDQSWPKFKGMFSSITTICDSIKNDINRHVYDDSSVSIISSNDLSRPNLDKLPASFMYSRILKEILCDINDHNSKEDLVHFWHQEYVNNQSMLKTIDEFERTYNAERAIYWYTRVNFVYSILNTALRTLDINVILKMGFFLRDLSQQIKLQHDQQLTNFHELIVYRGQGMSKEEFEKLKNSPNGLLSFNYFLSTSNDRAVSMMYCPIPSQDPNIIPVLFKIELDQNSKSVPFCSVEGRTNFSDEEEILFSMNQIFRIVKLENKKYEREDYWEITLKTTNDNDQDLERLTRYIQNEIFETNGWLRLGLLLLKMGELDKAEEIYQFLLNQSNDSLKFAVIYSQLGLIKHYKEEFDAALAFYEIARSSSSFLQLHPMYLSTMYNNMASVYASQGDFDKSLSFYNEATRIENPNDPELALIYNNMGKVHKDMGKYMDAIDYYKDALHIYMSSSTPEQHPAVVNIYNNIATSYYRLQMLDESEQYIKKALDTGERSLPFKHPYRTATYNCLGLLHKTKGNHAQALEFYKKAIESYQPTNSRDDLIYASICNNIGALYLSQRRFEETHEFFQKTLRIEQKYLPRNHPSLAETYSNIGAVYHTQKDYPVALEYYEKSLSIYTLLTEEHPELANTLNNIGVGYFELEHFSIAFEYFQRALAIAQRVLPTNHPKIKEYKGNADIAKAYRDGDVISGLYHYFRLIFSNVFRR